MGSYEIRGLLETRERRIGLKWLREWLPPTYQVVTKGQIINHEGKASRQIDVLVLKPFYPKSLHSGKRYFSAGVAAAFECKTTLKASHIDEATQICAGLKRLVSKFGQDRPTRSYTHPLPMGCWRIPHVSVIKMRIQQIL